MVARDPGIGNDQVLLHLAADAEWAVVEIECALLRSLNEDQAGKDARAEPGDRTDDGLGRHEEGKLVYQHIASKSRLREEIAEVRYTLPHGVGAPFYGRKS